MSCTSIANTDFQVILLIRLGLMSFHTIQVNYFKDIFSSLIHQLSSNIVAWWVRASDMNFGGSKFSP